MGGVFSSSSPCAYYGLAVLPPTGYVCSSQNVGDTMATGLTPYCCPGTVSGLNLPLVVCPA